MSQPFFAVLGALIGTVLVATLISYIVMPGIWQPMMTAADMSNTAMGVTTPAGMIQTNTDTLNLMAPLGVGFMVGSGAYLFHHIAEKKRKQRRQYEEQYY